MIDPIEYEKWKIAIENKIDTLTDKMLDLKEDLILIKNEQQKTIGLLIVGLLGVVGAVVGVKLV